MVSAIQIKKDNPYGSDLSYDGNDINPALTLTDDSSVVLEALAFRLQSDQGSLWYDSSYGFNINRLVKSPIVLSGEGIQKVKNRIETECKKDPRVQKAIVQVSEFNAKSKELIIQVSITLTNGVQDSLVFSLLT